MVLTSKNGWDHFSVRRPWDQPWDHGLVDRHGFRSRELFLGQDDLWRDVVRRDDPAGAQAAASAVAGAPQARDFLQAIDPTSVTMSHSVLAQHGTGAPS